MREREGGFNDFKIRKYILSEVINKANYDVIISKA